jgi:opacity protein-like surface antigen
MHTFTRLAAAALLVAAAPSYSYAQTLVDLLPKDADRWDVAVYAGRQGVNRRLGTFEWDSWYESAQAAGSVGYYLTPNLKLEAGVSRGATASLSLPIPQLPNQPWGYVRPREHRFRTSGGSAAVHYQFFRNQWFHPFAGVGVEWLHERQSADALAPTAEVRSGGVIVLPAIPALPAIAESRSTVAPFGSAGFKVYVSRRAFLRTDLQVALSRRGSESAVWRAGGGFDF